MKNIIIPKEEIEKYSHRIDQWNEIRPVEVKTDKGMVYTLPVCVLNLPKIDKFFNKLKALNQVDTVLKDMPVQDIKILPSEEIIAKK